MSGLWLPTSASEQPISGKEAKLLMDCGLATYATLFSPKPLLITQAAWHYARNRFASFLEDDTVSNSQIILDYDGVEKPFIFPANLFEIFELRLMLAEFEQDKSLKSWLDNVEEVGKNFINDVLKEGRADPDDPLSFYTMIKFTNALAESFTQVILLSTIESTEWLCFHRP